jgi:hypothetical protein
MLPTSKRTKLIDYGLDSHVTDTALHKILRQVRDEGLPPIDQSVNTHPPATGMC